MKPAKAVFAAISMTCLYVVALVWVDSRNAVISQLPRVAAALPLLMLLSFITYAVRYARWHWLLRRASYPTPVGLGFLAYLAGFAFTATPGKVGELVRIRYFQPMGVHPAPVLAAFVFERAFDLIAITLIASLAIQDVRLFLLLLAFVGCVLAAVAAMALRPQHLGWLVIALHRRGLHRLARVTKTLRDGLSGCRIWLTPLDVFLSLGLGLLAWGLAALAFVWLLLQLGIHMPLGTALSIYPTAMLAGAASMLPAGIGTTEVTIVALLSLNSVPLGIAALAAIGIRFASLWFAVVCGFTAVGILEYRKRVGRP